MITKVYSVNRMLNEIADTLCFPTKKVSDPLYIRRFYFKHKDREMIIWIETEVENEPDGRFTYTIRSSKVAEPTYDQFLAVKRAFLNNMREFEPIEELVGRKGISYSKPELLFLKATLRIVRGDDYSRTSARMIVCKAELIGDLGPARRHGQ